jgi:hypothetical protein
MFLVVGEFFFCCFVVLGSFMLHKSYPKLAEGLFLTYITFMLFNYFAVRWKYEYMKWTIMKFKRMRKKVSTFEFGLPTVVLKSSSQSTTQSAAPKKSK